MASPKRISSTTLEVDRAALFALQDVSDYAPRNDSHSTLSLQSIESRLLQAEQIEARARRTYELTRDEAIAAGRAFHSAMLGVKNEVLVQYGEDSYVVETVGLKKKSNYRRPSLRGQLVK